MDLAFSGYSLLLKWEFFFFFKILSTKEQSQHSFVQIDKIKVAGKLYAGRLNVHKGELK